MKAIQDQLSSALIERDAEIRACLLGLISREHVLLVGPPGTAKTLLATSLTAAIADARSFGMLLTKFTAPEELFGPVKLSGLKEDRYERAIAGYSPDCHILFVDEVWKASSAILNTTLTLLQERQFDNGGKRVECPLHLCIAASNEFPDSETGQELGAVFDRFLIRKRVRPVSPHGRGKLLYADLPAVTPCSTLAEVDAAGDSARIIPVGEEAKVAYTSILDELAAAGIRPGDRRVRKAVTVARAAAFLDGAPEVRPSHLEDLGMVLWTDPAQADQASEIVTRVANPVGARLNALLAEVDQVAQSATDASSQLKAVKQLEDSEAEASKLSKDGNGRAKSALTYIRRERIKLQAAILRISPEKAEAMLGAA